MTAREGARGTLKIINLQQPKLQWLCHKIYETLTCGRIDVPASSTDQNNKNLHQKLQLKHNQPASIAD